MNKVFCSIKENIVWICIILYATNLTAQIQGNIIDEDSIPVSYATIFIKSKSQGTVSDSLGMFTLDIPRQQILKDTLEIAYLGYETKRITISKKQFFYPVQLRANSLKLDQIVLVNKNPTDYIKQSLRKAKENYSREPYYLVNYFESNFYEDKELLMGAETVFKSYYKDTGGIEYPKQEHQLMLYNEYKTDHELQFMRKQIDKQMDKENNDMMDSDFKVRFTPFFIPIYHQSLPFLDSLKFKKFRYKLSENCSKRNLIVIDFRTKNRFHYNYVSFKGNGKIFIDCDNYAIAKVEFDVKGYLSFLIKSALFVAFHKVKINNVHLKGSVSYRPDDKGIWYPDFLYTGGEGQLTKVHWFSKNQKAKFEFTTNILVNEIIKDEVSIIPEPKRFSFRKLNLQNDQNIQWKDISKIKKSLY